MSAKSEIVKGALAVLEEGKHLSESATAELNTAIANLEADEAKTDDSDVKKANAETGTAESVADNASGATF